MQLISFLIIEEAALADLQINNLFYFQVFD